MGTDLFSRLRAPQLEPLRGQKINLFPEAGADHRERRSAFQAEPAGVLWYLAGGVGEARIEAIGLSKSFSGPPLFANVSFILERGILAVTGPNGAGKTTLLKILAGLARPTSGRIRIARDGRELSIDERRTEVGWAGPDLSFYSELTAEENLGFFRRAAGFTREPDDLRDRLDAVGLRSPGAVVEFFSTGMKQRLRIAFAFLLDPAVVLLDEPLSGLDAAGRRTVARFVAAAGESGPVVLAATDLSELPPPDRVLDLGTGSSPEAAR